MTPAAPTAGAVTQSGAQTGAQTAGKPSGAGQVGSQAVKPAAQSASDIKASQQASAAALSQMRAAEKAKFQRQAQPAAAGSQSGITVQRVSPPPSIKPGKTYRDYDSYYRNRDTYYRSRGWTPPAYIYRSYDRFDSMDALAFWFALDAATDAAQMAFLYNQMGTPAYQQWRAEADRLAAEDAQLKAKLDRLEAENARLRSQNVAQDPAYLPPGVNPETVLAAEAVVEEQPAGAAEEGGFPWFYTLLGLAIAGGLAVFVIRPRG